MLGKRLIKTSAGAACTTDTVQILDGVPFQSIATYELDGDATNLVDTGYIGKAGVFNGSSSYISRNSAFLPTGNASRTFSFWTKLDTHVTDAYFMSYGDGTTGQFFSPRVTPVSQGGYISFMGYAADLNSNVVMTTGEWMHLCYTYNGTTLKIYKNAVEIASGNLSLNTSQTRDFIIGARDYNGSITKHIDGSIDQVRIFNKALSSSEVTTLYGETSASSTKSTTDIFADSSGIALYEFEGNANDTGGNYNGTATNVVYNEYDGTASNVTYSTGKFGQAGVFNGSSGYIDLGSTIDDPLRTEGAFGVSFWFNANSYGSDSVIFKLLNDIYIYIFLNASNQIECRVSNSSGVQSTVTFGVSLNTWYHIVWTGNSTNGVTLYVNGSSVGNAAWDGTFFTYTNTTYKHNYLGYNGGNVGWYNGSIDQVRIYDKALLASDVTTLYNETVATASTNPTFNVPSLVAYYKMNDATDETGSYDGTPTNVNFNVAGKFGNAGEFNGSSSYINYDNFTFPANDFTFSAWANTNNVASQYNMITTIAKSGSGRMYLTFEYNKLFYYDFGSTVSLASSVGSISNNTWYHCLITKSSTDGIKLYLNGNLVDSNAATTSNPTNGTGENRIGHYYTPTSIGYFNGKIDQIRIFDRAITANEVTTLYNEVYCQPTIVPTNHFEPVLYTGDGGTQSISTLDFQPDFVWIKDRDTTGESHRLNDSVRGVGKPLYSNGTFAEGSEGSTGLTAFDSNGFSIGNATAYNNLNKRYVAWNWKAGGADVQNTDGTITSQVSANTDAGFSIVTWTGNGNDATVGTGLEQEAEFIIAKGRANLATYNQWTTYHKDLQDDYVVYLNLTNAEEDGLGDYWRKSAFTDNVFGLGNDIYGPNVNGTTMVAYCFHSVDGMSKIGSYVGVGSGNTVNVVTGFRPAMIIIKRTDSIEDWKIIDNKRDFANSLEPNESIAEEVGNNSNFSSHSNGFTIGDPHGDYNANGGTYIYMAFAEENVEPQPVLANSFNTVTYTGTGTTGGNTLPVTGFGFQPDLVWVKNRDVAVNHYLYDSVRGTGTAKALHSNATSSESTASAYAVNGGVSSFLPDGFTAYRGTDNTYQGTNMNGQDYVAWAWKASNESTINQEGSISSIVSANPASGFSVVKYSGAGTTASVGHGLSSAPDLVIIKNTNNLGNWGVYTSIGGAQRKLLLNSTIAEHTSSTWLNTPTSTVLNIQNDGDSGVSGRDYIAYCFHSVSGYQKVGSYSGGNSGSSNVITTGFKPSFLMVKRTDQAGDAWQMFDSIRGGGDTFDNYVQANESYAEVSYALREVNFTTNGFYWTNAESGTNISGGTYIYLAIKAN